jgi:hypothetical protein
MTKKEKEIQETFGRIEKCFERMDRTMCRVQYALFGIYTSLVGFIIFDIFWLTH